MSAGPLSIISGAGNGAANHTTINNAIQNRTLQRPVVIGGGQYDLEGTIGKDVLKTEWSVIGSGSGGDLVGSDGTWTGSNTGGSQATILYWNKKAATATDLDRALFRTDVIGVLIDRVNLRGSRRHSTGGTGTRHMAKLGEPTAWAAQSYAAWSFVTHTGDVWQAGSGGATSGDVPGVSGWTRRGYKGHIGIWHQSGLGRSNGPLFVPHASFGDLDVGVFAGETTTIPKPAGAEDGGWADTMHLGSVEFMGGVPVCVWIRAYQSVENHVKCLKAHGGEAADWADPAKGYNAAAWVEYGNLHIDDLMCGEYRTALYTGRQPHLYPVAVHLVRVDGNVSWFRLYKADPSIATESATYTIENFNVPNNWHNRIEADGKPVAAPTWSSLTAYALNTIVTHGSSIFQANQDTSAGEEPGVSGKWTETTTNYAQEPLVHAGPGRLILRNGAQIRPASIKLEGKISSNRPAIVILENCSFTESVTSLADVIHLGSSGPYYIAWRNCARVESTGSYRLRVFEDDEIAKAGGDGLSDFKIRAPVGATHKQAAPATANTTTELTQAHVLNGIITSTHTTGGTLNVPLPAGATLEPDVDLSVDEAFEWTLINLSAAAADTVTLTATTGHTIVGSAVVPSAHSTTGGTFGNAARFRTRRTAANTFVTYRID